MKSILAFLFILQLPFSQASYPVKCSKLDFFFSTSNCCDENNDATCLESIPHKEYTADVKSLESTLVEIGLCSNDDQSCIKDLPSLSYLRDRIKNITDGGVEIAVQVANAKQNAHANLDAISQGEMPSLNMKSGSTFTVESGATMRVEGTLDVAQLNTGLTAATATQIGHLQVGEIHGPVDFNSHLLSEVNLNGFKIDGADVVATAAEINILNNVDTGLTFNDINKLKGLQANAQELNPLHNSGVVKADLERLSVNVLGETQANKVVTADAQGKVTFKNNVEIDGDLDLPYGKLKIGGVVIDKTAAELNDAVAHFVGLTASAGEINSALDGILASSADLNKLHLSSATPESLARLNIAQEGISEAGKVVTSDSSNKVTFTGDVDVTGTLSTSSLKLAGVAVTATAQEINVLDGITALASELNRLSVTPGQSESGKALVTDANGNLQLNGDLTMGSTSQTTTVPATATEVTTGNCAGGNCYCDAHPTIAAGNAMTLEACKTHSAGATRFSHDQYTCAPCADNAQLYSGSGQKVYEIVPESTTVTTIAQKLILPEGSLTIGGVTVQANAAELNILDGVDPALQASHLNPFKDFSGDWSALDVLSGVTASNTELSYLDIAELGKSEPSKAITSDSNNKVEVQDFVVLGTADLASFSIGGIAVTATANQLSSFAGFTADATSLNKLQALDVSVASDLNKLKDVVSDATDLNRADITTPGQSEASKVVTADANGDVRFKGDVVIDGQTDVTGTLKINGVSITATGPEINVMDGYSGAAADINRLVVSALGQSEASKVVTADAQGKVKFTDVDVTGTLNAKGTFELNGSPLTSSAADINAAVSYFNSITASASEVNTLESLTATSAELNSLDGYTGDSSHLNRLVVSALGQSEASKVVTADANGKVTFKSDLEIQGDLDIPSGKLSLGGVVLDASHDGDDINAATNHFLGLTVSSTELNVLDGITATTAELNKLDGVTASTAELNYVAGITLGTSQANKVVTTNAGNKATIENVDVTGTLDATNLKIAGVAVSATAADLNKLSGLTVSSSEINVLDGYTGDVNDLNKLSGLTAGIAPSLNKLNGLHNDLTSAHLNVMKDVTATAADLNKLKDVTATAANLDKVKDLTATSAELNALASVTPGSILANKAVVADANGDLSSANTVTVSGNLDATTLKIGGVAVTASAADLNSVATLASHEAKLLNLATVSSTAAEIDSAVTKAGLVSEADLTKLSQITAQASDLNTCADFLLSQSAEAPTCTQFGQLVFLTKGNGDTELHFCKGNGQSIGPFQ